MPERTVKTLALHGGRELVTRTSEQGGAFSERLRALGAIAVEFPTIRIVPPDDWEPLDKALRRLCTEGGYDWLVFTSANGVRICCERLSSLGYDVRTIGNVRIAAIGPATAAALARYGVTVDLVPGEYIAEGVAAALIDDARQRRESLVGEKVLLARAAEARNDMGSVFNMAAAYADVVA